MGINKLFKKHAKDRAVEASNEDASLAEDGNVELSDELLDTVSGGQFLQSVIEIDPDVPSIAMSKSALTLVDACRLNAR